MQVEDSRTYRVRDVAGHFDVSVSTIYRAIESGQLDALKLGTAKGTLRVPGSSVLAYAEACGQAACEHSPLVETGAAAAPGEPDLRDGDLR
jgi:excisionase family DNA binding protein